VRQITGHLEKVPFTVRVFSRNGTPGRNPRRTS
jgi:hypothetical protein